MARTTRAPRIKAARKTKADERMPDLMDLADLMNDTLVMPGLVNTPELAEQLCQRLEAVDEVGFDTETTGLNPGREDLTVDDDVALDGIDGDLLVGLSVAVSETEGYYVPIRHWQARTLKEPYVRRILDLVVSRKRVYIHNAAFDHRVLWNYYDAPVFERMVTVDTMQWMHTLYQGEDVGDGRREKGSLGLKNIVRRLFHRSPNDLEWIGPSILRAPMAALAEYAIDDALNVFILGKYLERETVIAGTRNYLETVGLPFVNVLSGMHYRGILLDREKLGLYQSQAQEKIEEILDRLSAAYGQRFNPDSPDQVDHLIYDHVGLPMVSERTASGRRSLAGEDIQYSLALAKRSEQVTSEQAELIQLYLDHQSLAKIQSTFITALLTKSAKTGRIYPEFHVTGAVSGRLSSSNPNAQNIVSGRKSNIAGLKLDIRSCFIADPGCMLVTYDENALEIRVLTHFSGEPVLVKALHLPKKQGGDPHQATANQIGVGRDQAKTIGFGIIYGMSAHGLSRQLGISTAEAQLLIDKYFQGMPCVCRWLQESHTQILQTGAVRTLAQRIRSTTLHRHANKAIREGAVRSVTNTIIQGSAADIVNSAMVGITNDARWRAMGSRIIMQVHDEIVANVPEQHAEDGAAIMKFYMCNPFGAGNYLRVPLMVEGAISHSWEK